MKRIASVAAAFIVLVAMLMADAVPAAGWAGEPVPPPEGYKYLAVHGWLAIDALTGQYMNWESERVRGLVGLENWLPGIAQYADSVDSLSPHGSGSCHRVREYQDIYQGSPFLGASCGLPGAEWQAAQFMLRARQYYNAGDEHTGDYYLGFAIHFIADCVCPPHVFPFKQGWSGDSGHTHFELYTLAHYHWGAQVSSAEVEPIETPAELARELQMAADEVSRLPCTFVAEDGRTYASSPDGTMVEYAGAAPEWGWSMEDAYIGQCMQKAGSLIKGAALWATRSGLPPTVGQGRPNTQPFVECYSRPLNGEILCIHSYCTNLLLGDPIDNPGGSTHRWGDGYIQDFRGGSGGDAAIMLADGGNMAHAVHGSIWSKYKATGGATGSLGYPLTDELGGPINGSAPSKSSVSEAEYKWNEFVGGAIVYHATGSRVGLAVSLGRGIFDKWEDLYYGAGPLGLPISDETDVSSSSTAGAVCDFEAGHIYWRRTGALSGQSFEVHGAIDARYQALGGSDSSLGFPITDEYEYPAGSGYKRSDFEGGYIWYHDGTAEEHTYSTTAPDLTVTSVNANTQAAPGSYLTVSWTTRNNGGKPSGSLRNGIYLGSSLYGTTVATLGSFSMASIAVGSFLSDTQIVQIPSTLSPGDYFVSVYADANGAIAESDEMNNIGSRPISIGSSSSAPASPSNLVAATMSSRQIVLGWQRNSNNETGFRIERKSAGGSYSQLATVGSGVTVYPDNNLTPNTTYCYRVIAFNASGDSALWSNEYCATTYPTSINAPSGLVAAAVSTTRVDLTWQHISNGEVGFKIERSTSGGAYEQIGTTPIGTRSYTDTSVVPDTNYCYRVRAYTNSADSSYSEASCTSTSVVPAAPSNLSATAISKTEIGLIWRSNSFNETRFEIERKTGSTGTYAPIGTTAAGDTSYTSSELQEGTTYFYRVRACNDEGCSTYCMEDHATTLSSATVACSPQNLSFRGTEGGANPASQTLSIWNAGDESLNWSAADDADWLALSPASGTSDGETDCVEVSVDLSGLAPGRHNASVLISSPSGPSVTVAVTLTVYALRESGPILRVPQDYPTINAAISAAGSPYAQTTVIVSPGTYNEVVYMVSNVNILGEDKYTTFITAPGGSGYAVNGASNARISGFTIQGGINVIDCGFYTDTSSPEIVDNIIQGGSSYQIAAKQGASPVIRNNIIFGQTYFNASSPVISNNIMHSIGSWHCIQLEEGSNATITNNVIDSSDFNGSAIYFGSASDVGTVRNNIFANLYEAIGNPYSAGVSGSYNDFFNVAVRGIPNQAGDRTADPLFVSLAAGDYRLQDTSPCIDAGDPSASFYDTSFPPSKGTQRNDMGAYGGPWTAHQSAPSVSLYSFLGGEEVQVRDHVEIMWGAADDIQITGIDIYYSTDGGATYPYAIVTGLENDGGYLWTIPDTLSDACRVKVVAHDYEGNTSEATSAADFAIIPSTNPIVGTEVSGVITENTTWGTSGSPYLVTGDVTVAASATLTVEPGVTVRFYPDKSLRIDGELVAVGTETDGITFTSDRSAPEPGDWCCILFTDSAIDARYEDGEFTGGGIVRFCTVEYAGEGDVGAIRIESASPLIDCCTIRNNSYCGIEVDHGSPVISNSTFTMNSGYMGGAIYAAASDVVIVTNTIERNTAWRGGGICIDGGSASIIDNAISHNSISREAGNAICITNGCSAYVDGNTITYNSGNSMGGAVYISGSTVTLSRNTMSHNDAAVAGAVYLEQSIVTITHNTMSGNWAQSSTILQDSGALTLTYNEIVDNANLGDAAICILYAGQAVVHNNNIYGNTPKALQNNTTNTIDATNNWWGAADEAAIGAAIVDQSDPGGYGPVQWHPYLTEEIGLSDVTPPSVTVTDDGYYSSDLTQLHARWVANDGGSGITECQYAVGTAPGATDTVPWTSAGTDTEVLVTGLTLAPGATYYFSVKVKNGVGLWSVVATSDGITVDNTPPSTPLVADDGQFTWTTSELHATWAASDDESAIAEFQFAVGTAAGSTDIVGWTSAGLSTEATAQGLNLTAGQTYYFALKSRNGAGLWSELGISDGIEVDNTTPTTPVVIDDGEHTASSTELHATWSTSDPESGIVEYRYAIGTSPGDADVIGWTSAGTSTEVTATGLTLSPDDTHYFAVQARNGAGLWSEVAASDGISFADGTPPPTPAMAYPADLKVTNDNTPWLDWSDVTDPSGVLYGLQVDDSADFSSPVVNKSGLTTSSRTISPALADGTYYWRVRAVDGGGSMSDWSAPWSFTINTVSVPVPALSYPADLKATRDNTPWLDWSDVTGVAGVKYQLQVDNDADFSSPLLYKTGMTASSRTLGTLADGTYYWRVRAVDGAGKASAWAAPWSFTVDTLAPTVPALSYPADGIVTTDTTPWLDWADVTDATGVTYRLQVDNNADFSSPVVNKSGLITSSRTLSTLAPGTYYWRVRVTDGAGNVSAWTASRSFTVQ